MSDAPRFDFEGDPARLPEVTAALKRVIDPEMALDVVELGLVYSVALREGGADVRITMTSAACPVTDIIVDDVTHELQALLGPGAEVAVEVCWDPAWTPERMSSRARDAMGWE